MNKARLTYRFDRTGLKEEDAETAVTKEPWHRDAEPEEAYEPLPAQSRPQEFTAASSLLTERAAERQREAAAAERRREREEALRRSRPEPWEWSAAPSRSRDYGGKPENNAGGYDDGRESRREYADAGTGRAGKVIPLHEEEWRGFEQDRDWSGRYEDADGGHERGRSYQDETLRIESLIRETESRSRRERDSNPHEGWEDGNGRGEYKADSSARYDSARPSDRGYGYHPGGYSNYRGPEVEESLLYPEARQIRRRNLGWLKVAASLAGALLVGGMLGYYVLTLFSGSSSKNGATPTDSGGSAIVQTGTGDTGAATGANAAGNGEKTASAALQANVSIPEKTFVLLQNGKFSTAESAGAAASALDGGGYAAATEPGDSYFVYAGIAADRESARILENKLKAGRFEVYAKEYTLPAVTQVEWSGDPVPLQAYLEETNRLAQMMSGLTLVHLDEESVTPLDATSLASIKKAHQTWTQKAAAVKTGAPQSAKALLQKMDNAVNTAEKSLEAYSKNPSTSLLNQAQSNLMTCILSEKQLLAAIGGQ